MRLLSLIATPDEENSDRDQVTLVLDDGTDEHALTFDGYPTLSLHFGSGDQLHVSYALARTPPGQPYENGLRLPSQE